MLELVSDDFTADQESATLFVFAVPAIPLTGKGAVDVDKAFSYAPISTADPDGLGR